MAQMGTDERASPLDLAGIALGVRLQVFAAVPAALRSRLLRPLPVANLHPALMLRVSLHDDGVLAVRGVSLAHGGRHEPPLGVERADDGVRQPDLEVRRLGTVIQGECKDLVDESVRGMQSLASSDALWMSANPHERPPYSGLIRHSVFAVRTPPSELFLPEPGNPLTDSLGVQDVLGRFKRPAALLFHYLLHVFG